MLWTPVEDKAVREPLPHSHSARRSAPGLAGSARPDQDQLSPPKWSHSRRWPADMVRTKLTTVSWAVSIHSREQVWGRNGGEGCTMQDVPTATEPPLTLRYMHLNHTSTVTVWVRTAHFQGKAARYASTTAAEPGKGPPRRSCTR